MKAISILMIVAVIAVSLAAFNLIVHFEDIKSLTGFATVGGTANLTIAAQASVEFTTAVINWQTGSVDELPTSALLDTGTGNVTDGNWTAVSQGLVLENDGNSNVTVNLTTSNTAAVLIGGSAVTPTFKLNISSAEANSCADDDNEMIAYTEATGSEQFGCTNFSYYDALDTITINVQLRIPEDAPPGAKGTVITATATPI